jgi:ABC-type multidrug transport system ATPase subunit
MDRLVILDHGRIIEEGSHADLLKARRASTPTCGRTSPAGSWPRRRPNKGA